MSSGAVLRVGPLILALILGACGGGQTAATPTATTAATSAASAAATAQPLKEYKLVAFLDYSGPFANRGKPIAALHQIMVDKWNNEQGTKLGVKLTYQALDSQYNDAKTNSLYDQVRTDKSVIGILTHGSPNVNALWNRVPADQLPVLHGGPCYSFIAKPNGYVFTAVGDYTDFFRTTATYFAGKSTTSPLTVGFITFDGTSGHDWADGLAARMPAGTKLVATEFIATSAPDVSANVRKIVAAKPDITIVAGTDRLQPMVIEGLEKAGYPASKIVSSQHESIDLMLALGVAPAVMEGTYEVTSWDYTDTSTAGYKAVAEGKAKYPDARWTSGDVLLHFASSVIMLNAIGRAATKKGGANLNGAAVYDELKNGTFTNQDLLGFMDTVKFDQTVGGCATPSTVSLLQLKGGKIQSAGKLNLAK